MALTISPWWNDEAIPCTEARAKGKGPKVCDVEVISVAKPHVPEIHVDVRPGGGNLVKWALKGQNYTLSYKALNLSCLSWRWGDRGVEVGNGVSRR